MKRYYLLVLTVAVFVIAAGINTVLAGSSSDTNGEGYHCYGFFTLPDGTFAQFMANSSEEEDLVDTVVDAFMKYVGDEGGELMFMVCGTADTACLITSTIDEHDLGPGCDDEIDGLIDTISYWTYERGSDTHKDSWRGE